MNTTRENQSGYIKKLYLRNFRKFEKAEIEFKNGFNFLIGPNNSGKSTILQALDILFGEKNLSSEKVEDVMFNEKNTQSAFFTIASEIEFPRCGSGANKINIIKNLKEARGSGRSKLSNYVLNEKLDIYDLIDKRKVIDSDNSSFSDNTKQEGSVLDSRIYFICDVTKNIEGINVDYFLFLESDSNDFNGLKIPISPYQIKKILSFLLIPAGRSENNQLFKIEPYTWLGEYLKDIQSKKQKAIDTYCAERVENSFPIQPNSGVTEIFNRIVPDSKNYKVEINSFNAQYPDQLYKYSHFFVKDPACEEIYYKGHGIQSAIAMSLFGDYLKSRCELQIKNRDVGQLWAGILALEEPECHFHPPVRMRLSKVLKETFIDLGAQVIISTHDENFPKWPKINNANLIFPNSIKAGIVSTRNFIGDNSDIERMMRFMSSTFYGNKVVIVEGREVDCINAIFDNLFDEDLSDNGIGIVQAVTRKPRSDKTFDEPSGGVDDIVKMVELYKDLGIKVVCLIDADNIFFKKPTVENIYEKLTGERINLNIDDIVDKKTVEEIKEGCNKCKKRFGPEIMNHIREIGASSKYVELVKPLNDKGILFFNVGDFEANFNDEFLTVDLLSGDKMEINKERFAYSVKHKAETENSSYFKGILSDNAEKDLNNNLKLIKEFFEQEQENIEE